jgi:hypothetical protein
MGIIFLLFHNKVFCKGEANFAVACEGKVEKAEKIKNKYLYIHI